MEPPSPIFAWLFRVVLALGLFLVGAFLTVFLGAITGMSFGAGPELMGGFLYVLIGVIINFVMGAALAATISRRSSSRSTPRLVFYSFTAPAFLVVLCMAYSFFTQTFR